MSGSVLVLRLQRERIYTPSLEEPTSVVGELNCKQTAQQSLVSVKMRVQKAQSYHTEEMIALLGIDGVATAGQVGRATGLAYSSCSANIC